MKILKTFFFVAALGFGLTSCKKDDILTTVTDANGNKITYEGEYVDGYCNAPDENATYIFGRPFTF